MPLYTPFSESPVPTFVDIQRMVKKQSLQVSVKLPVIRLVAVMGERNEREWCCVQYESLSMLLPKVCRACVMLAHAAWKGKAYPGADSVLAYVQSSILCAVAKPILGCVSSYFHAAISPDYLDNPESAWPVTPPVGPAFLHISSYLHFLTPRILQSALQNGTCVGLSPTLEVLISTLIFNPTEGPLWQKRKPFLGLVNGLFADRLRIMSIGFACVSMSCGTI